MLRLRTKCISLRLKYVFGLHGNVHKLRDSFNASIILQNFFCVQRCQVAVADISSANKSVPKMFSVVKELFCWIGVYASILWLYYYILEPLANIVWGSIRCLVRQEKLSVRYGPWAVITGATDGIGKCYAENLARKGLKIMLISRTESKLIKVADELHQKYGVQTDWIAMDFSNGPEIYDRLRKQLTGLDIGLLVNNVGFLPQLAHFDQTSESDLLDLIHINMMSTTMLTRMVLPEMKARRRGIVVNIGSTSGLIPLAYMAAYAATKSYVSHLSQGLQEELRGTGVECQLVTPAMVRTNLSQTFYDKMPWYVVILSPEQVARIGVFLIGKTWHTCGHWFHSLQVCWYPLLPRKLVVRIMGGVMKSTANNMH
ncbi:inactive hydroxysteroid dehydrogenase-like protein 1 [Malaya genurostris]|uniref:inactive hydroxysteroid dehydrogenase-like protein 1 n=1 Tax=Malaya genurostris TaxID=325434 RepID=UPI0026F3E9D9|nr:inactive hydroxysteroid dehydrogenase-like protein 1 [Malaya genurostris]